MVHVTLAYSAIARNLSPAALVTAMAAIPLDTDDASLAGLTLTSDLTVASGNRVTRTIVYETAAEPPLIPDANIGETLTNWYTTTFAKALRTPVVAATPVVS